MQQDAPMGGERPAEAAERKEWEDFRHEISALERTMGPQIPLPDSPTDDQLDKLMEGVRKRVVITNFHELTRANEITHKRYAIQQAGNLDRGAAFDRESYIASMQAATYCEGLGEIGQFIADSMRNYELCQDLIVALPAAQRKALEGRRRMATTYMRGLRNAMDERVRFASARQLVLRLGEEQRRPEGERRAEVIDQLTKQRDDLLPLLSEDSRRIVNVPNPTPEQQNAMLAHANMLERRIIGIAAGSVRQEGVDAGFVPTTLYLEILEARYRQIQQAQKDFVTAERHLQEGGGAFLTMLNRERESVMTQMVTYTNDLVGYQMRMTQLSTQQELFGNRFSTENAMPAAGPIRAEDRTEINRGVTAMRNFHLDRVDRVVNQANVEFRGGVLSPEQMRDALIAGTVNAAQVSVWLARILTLGGYADLGNRVQDFIAGPIVDALGWPRNPDGSPKLRLTPEEAAAIARRLGSLNDTVTAFRRNNNGTQIRDTVSALRALDTSRAISATRIGRVREPLPAGNLTAAQVDGKLTELERTYGNREDAVATVHAMLIRQLHGYWGTLEANGRSGTGFIGAYAGMLTEIERIIGVQIDVAGACFHMAKNMFDLSKYLAYAGVSVGMAQIIGPTLITIGALSIRPAATAAWRGIQWARGPRVAAPPAGTTPPPAGAPPEPPLRATPMQRGVWVGAVGYEAYRLYETGRAISRENERLNDVKAAIAAQLVLAGFTRGEGDVYTHACGARIRLAEMNEQLDAQRQALYVRGGAQAIGLGSMLLMGPRLFAGPAGWALIAIQIVVESGITAWENQAARRLIANPNTPPWLIAALGTSRLVNRSEYDMLVNSSSWNFLFTSTEEEKEIVRKKSYFAIFSQEIGSASPELLREMMAGARNVAAIDGIYNTDFQNMLLPYLYVRLYQRARARNSGIGWPAVRDGRVDRGWVVIPSDITALDIRGGMREIGLLYVQHLREKRFIAVLQNRDKLRADLAANPGDRAKQVELTEANHALAVMGNDVVLGSPLSTLTPAQITANAGKTRAQMLMEAIYAQVNARPDPPSFALNAEAVRGIGGLPAAITRDGFDFSNNTAVLRYATDNDVQRVNMDRIGPLTTTEREAQVYPDWNDWDGNIRRLLTLPIGRDDEATLNGYRIVANNVSGGTRMPRLPDNASGDAARDRITEAGIAYFNAERAPAGFRLDNTLAAQVYARNPNRPPLVYSNLDDGGFRANGERQRRLCESLSTPDSGGAAFDLRNVRAVFFEGRRLPSGHDVVLATYVYGDVRGHGIGAGKDRIFVMQQAAGSGGTVREEFRVRGRGVAYNESGFTSQRGGRAMIDLILRETYAEDMRRERDRQEEAARLERERPAREKREAEEREKARLAKEKAEKERELRIKRIAADLERARKSPNTLILTETPEGGSRYVMFYRNVGGGAAIERTIYLPRYVRPGPAGPAFEAAPSGATRPAEHTCQLTISDGTREWTANVPWNFMTSNDVSMEDRRMFSTVLFSATPGRTNEGMDRIFAMMPRNDRMNVTQLRDDFERLYDGFRDKQIPLYYLALNFGANGGIHDRDVVTRFERYSSLFTDASNVDDLNRISRGMTIFREAGVTPDRFGIYRYNADPARGVSTLYYRYRAGGWQWTPDLENWMPSTQTMVEGGRYNRRSPTGLNCNFINSLPR